MNNVNTSVLAQPKQDSSTRIYLAARAPQEIPPWFIFKSSKPCPKPLNHVEIADPKVRDDVRLAMCCDQDPVTKAGFEWMEQSRQVDMQILDYQRQMEIDRYFAWRWYYADMMLATQRQQLSPGFMS